MPSPNKVIRDIDSGNTFNVAINHPVTVQLKGNPTTGFVWVYSSNAPDGAKPVIGLAQGGKTRYADQFFSVEEVSYKVDHKGMLGSGGTYLFRVTPLMPGSHMLRFVYERPWETDTKPAREFTVQLNVE